MDFDSSKLDKVGLLSQHHFEKTINERAINEDPTFGLHKLGIKNGFLAEATLLIVGLGWLIGGLCYGLLFYSHSFWNYRFNY